MTLDWLVERACGRRAAVVHEEEAAPLRANLGDAEQPGRARERRIDLAARDIRAARGQHEDVGDGACSGRGAQEDEVRRQALGGATRNDAVVLGNVGDEDADEDQAVQ